MEISTRYIKAIGSMLYTYESDLEYIARFQDAKKGKYNNDYFDGKLAGSFKAFINEYRVARNIRSNAENENNTKKLLDISIEWLDKSNTNPYDVDGFADMICKAGITPFGRTPVSLSSKI